MKKPLSSSRRSRKTWRACSPGFPSKARCPRRHRLRQDRPNRRKPECGRRRHRRAGSTIAVAVPTAVAVLRRRMVIAVNVAIVEVCLHAAVRSSGPQASVRSCPHRVKSAVLSIGRSLPVFSDKQTISEPRRDFASGPDSEVVAKRSRPRDRQFPQLEPVVSSTTAAAEQE